MWDKKQIDDLIQNGTEENLHLDYKSANALAKSDGKKKEISKDVSAFANSDGGTIIYGVKEFDEVEKRHLPERIDAVDRIEFTKEWLEQVIGSNIAPRIQGLKITPVPNEGGKQNEVIYVVDIPKSDTAHQAIDKRYYRRYNFESIPMEDWEIKDIINRSVKSNIQLEFRTSTPKDLIEDWVKRKVDFTLEFEVWAYNKGRRVAQMVNCFIYGDERASETIIKPLVKVKDNFFEELFFSNEVERKITIEGNEFIMSTERIPILPETRRYMSKLTIHSPFLIRGLSLFFQISSEDNNIQIEIKGMEILN